jgi:O-antigen ligase
MRHQAEEIFKQHPWFGVGIEGIAPYVRHYPATRTPADAVSYNNQFLELLDETGIIGALLFYVFLGLIVAYGLSKVQGSKQSPNAWAVGLICIVIAITIQAQSFSGFLITYIWMIYGLLAGIIIRDDTISA